MVVAQHCECTKCHWVVHCNVVNCYVNFSSIFKNIWNKGILKGISNWLFPREAVNSPVRSPSPAPPTHWTELCMSTERVVCMPVVYHLESSKIDKPQSPIQSPIQRPLTLKSKVERGEGGALKFRRKGELGPCDGGRMWWRVKWCPEGFLCFQRGARQWEN